jgi:hypothetical protein
MSAMLRKIISTVLMATLLVLAGAPAAHARFLTPDTYDPWEEGVDTNRYSYSGNDAINKSDPNGHVPVCASSCIQPTTPEDLDNLQLGLDAAGFAGPFGPFADTLNTGISAIRGNWSDATVNAMAIIPIFGDAFKATKMGTKVIAHINDIKKTTSIWSNTKNLNSVENAFSHWKKHSSEFPELFNSKQYVDAAKKFISEPPSGTLTKIRPNGDKLFYNPKTNTFVATTKDGVPKTMFKPKNGKDYWKKQ